MFPFWDHVRAIFGPGWDHVWPNFTSRPARALTFSKQRNYHIWPITINCYFLGPCQGHFWTMIGPCFPSFTSEPIIALKYAKYSQHNLRQMSMEFLLFKTMSGPCLDLDWVMFGLFSHPDQLDF